MDLIGRLASDRDVLVEKWFDLILSTYPPETQKIWKKNKDAFGNPVGATFEHFLPKLFDLLLEWKDRAGLDENLEEIIKIRAVQNFTPGKALSFIYKFKELIRDTYQAEMNSVRDLEELLSFESRLDNLALMAFDIYVKRRDQVLKLRVDEVKRAQHMLLRKAGILVDDPASEAG